jgi:hypothetical protein
VRLADDPDRFPVVPSARVCQAAGFNRRPQTLRKMGVSKGGSAPRYQRRQKQVWPVSLAGRGGLISEQALLKAYEPTSARIVAPALPWRRRFHGRGEAVAPTGHDRISLVMCASAAGSEKRNPAKAGIKFIHFGGILQTAGDRGDRGAV